MAIQAVCRSDLWWERYWHGHSLPHPYHHPLHHHSPPPIPTIIPPLFPTTTPSPNSTTASSLLSADVSSRDIRRISLNAFKADVGALQLNSSDLLHSYNSGLREVLDKHAPLRHRRITDRPSAPWLTVQIKEAKQQRRCAERRWRKSGLTVHRQIFIHHREKVKKLFLQAKKNYVCNKIESSSSCKDLFHITDQLSGKKMDITLPSSIPTVDLPDTLEISSRLRSRDSGMSLMLHLDNLTSRSSVVPLLKPSPLWQSSKWKISSLKPRRSHAFMILSQRTYCMSVLMIWSPPLLPSSMSPLCLVLSSRSHLSSKLLCFPF